MSEKHTPFPLNGGRAGDGGEIPSTTAKTSTPNPDPSPIKGEGRRASILTARRLRKNATVAERDLWKELRARKLNIRRQAPIGPYIADFACHIAKSPPTRANPLFSGTGENAHA